MLTSKGEYLDNKGIITKILMEIKETAKIEIWTEANSNETMYKVLDEMGQVVYLIKQYYKLKSQDGLIFKEQAKKKKEISDLLSQYTSYVDRVVDVISEECTSEINGAVYVVTEILLEYGGMDLMQYWKEMEVDQSLLLNVLYQSALAIATAHQHGIFHCDIKPRNMVYNRNTLKLVEFGTSSMVDCEAFIDKLRIRIASDTPGCTPLFYPPEIQYYESVRGEIQISLGKIDVFFWGMSMLQFLTGMSDAMLGDLTLNKRSYVDWCGAINVILKIRIPQFSEETSSCIMKVIAKCLEYYPWMRLNMEDVLACLVSPNEEFSPIISSLPDKMRKQYSIEIQNLEKQYHFASQMLTDVKCVEEKKILSNDKKVAKDIDSFLEPALTYINQILESEETTSDPLFQRITFSKEKQIDLSESMENFLTVAAGLMKSSTLIKLNLWDNKIGDIGAQLIATTLLSNCTLSELNLGCNSIGDTGAEFLAIVLQSNSTLIILNLKYNDIGVNGAEFLATALHSNSTLKKLDLRTNNIGNAGAEFFATALQSNSSLTKLYLGGNRIGQAGAEYMATALQSNSTLLKLYFGYNFIGIEGAELMAIALQSNYSLTKLYLAGNQIGEAGAEFIASALRSNSTLTELDLKETNIGVKGTEFIATALRSNSSLTKLDLTDIKMGGTGVEYIATALQSNYSLKKLYLTYNSIGVKGSEFIATALQSNSTLTELYLAYNKIDVKSIATALKSNSTLTKLDLSVNSIGATGAKFIATALQSNSTLIELNLRFNTICDTGAEFIATALQSNSTLMKLNIGDNNLTNKAKSLLKEAAAKNGKCTIYLQEIFKMFVGEVILAELMKSRI